MDKRPAIYPCHTPRWTLSKLAILVSWAAAITLVAAAQAHYSDLSPEQQAAFRSFCTPPGCNPTSTWEQSLNASQRLEFGGGTHAIGTVSIGNSITGLDEISNFVNIVGSVSGVQSPDQFHLDVIWRDTSVGSFNVLQGWSNHLSWLHNGMFGYQQNAGDMPSGGVVVLFEKSNQAQGQFHIDMRFWGHFGVDNGNIDKNYGTYCDWYGAISGYKPCPEGIASVEQPENPIPLKLKSTAAPLPLLRDSVKAFLTTWYIDRDLDTLGAFVARDNVFAYNKGQFTHGLTSMSAWKELFGGAFVAHTSALHPAALGEVLDNYQPPTMPPGTKELTYLNAGDDGLPKDRFAIINVSSLPPGSLLPTPATQERSSRNRSFLVHLVSGYHSEGDPTSADLAIVVYLIRPHTGLVRETAVTYWIREEGLWKLAAYNGTD